jgi:stage II sporulation protein GA (sporulation sigma-E factor processing peptidase)
MEQEVYVDLYFLINTCMNLLTLMITASLLHRKVSRWRAWLAAAAGGLWAVAALFWGVMGIWGLLMDGAVIFLMCAAVFANKKTKAKSIFKCTLVGVLTSMILGGVMTALYALFNRIQLPLGKTEENSSSLLIFAFIAALAGLATAQGGRFLGLSKKTEYVTVSAVLFGKTITLRALVDTGNHLREPISGRSVIVADRAHILAALPPVLSMALQSSSPNAWLADQRYATHIRLIPTNTATGAGMLPAILPDKITLSNGKETYSADYLIAPAPMESNSDFNAVIAMH